MSSGDGLAGLARGAVGQLVLMGRHRLGVSLPSELFFFVTYHCNLACPGCFYSTAMERGAGLERELDLDEVTRVSRSLGTLQRLWLSGGEPMLRADLPDICRTFSVGNRVEHIHLPTNGMLPDRIAASVERILESCASSRVTVSFSIDGFEQTHDGLRGRPGSFQAVLRSVDAVSGLRRRHPNLETNVNTVVSDANIGEVVPLASFVMNDLRLDAFSPSLIRPAPRGPRLPPLEEWSDTVRTLAVNDRARAGTRSMRRWRANVRLNRVEYLQRTVVGVLRSGSMPFRCAAGRAMAVLEPNGDVKLCETTGVVGNLRDAAFDFGAIWRGAAARDMRNRLTHCSCTHPCFLSTSSKLDLRALAESTLLVRR